MFLFVKDPHLSSSIIDVIKLLLSDFDSFRT